MVEGGRGEGEIQILTSSKMGTRISWSAVISSLEE